MTFPILLIPVTYCNNNIWDPREFKKLFDTFLMFQKQRSKPWVVIIISQGGSEEHLQIQIYILSSSTGDCRGFI